MVITGKPVWQPGSLPIPAGHHVLDTVQHCRPQWAGSSPEYSAFPCTLCLRSSYNPSVSTSSTLQQTCKSKVQAPLSLDCTSVRGRVMAGADLRMDLAGYIFPILAWCCGFHKASRGWQSPSLVDALKSAVPMSAFCTPSQKGARAKVLKDNL